MIERFHGQLKVSLAASSSCREKWADTLPLTLLGIRLPWRKISRTDLLNWWTALLCGCQVNSLPASLPSFLAAFRTSQPDSRSPRQVFCQYSLARLLPHPLPSRILTTAPTLPLSRWCETASSVTLPGPLQSPLSRSEIIHTWRHCRCSDCRGRQGKICRHTTLPFVTVSSASTRLKTK